MTIDDGNSIYVGGLPYDIAEDELRREFDLYGSIVAVKIVNDRAIGGKCYGFVTFTNPRSATDAINDMNGKTIGGRVVKVNDVKTRGAGGRSNYGRDVFQHSERDMDRNRGRGRERVQDPDRDRYHDHSRGVDRTREKRYEHADLDRRSREHLQDRDRDQPRIFDQRERAYSRGHSGEWERDRSRDRNQGGQFDRVDRDREDEERTDQKSDKKSRSGSYDERIRELSSGSSDYHQFEEELEMTMKQQDELREEISEIEERLEEKRRLIVGLQKRSVNLEDELTSAKKLTSLRQKQLTKLHKCYLQVMDYGERFKSSEQELQDLAHSVMLDLDAGVDVNGKDRYLAK